MFNGMFGTKNEDGSVSVRLNPTKIVWGLCAAAVIIVAIICVMNRKPTINLDKYLTIEEDGINGYGMAGAHIDWQAIEAKYGEKISFTENATNELGGLLILTNPMMVLEAGVDVYLDKSSGLSNGDTVSYTWQIDEELSKYVDCRVRCKNGTFKVSRLDELETFDAFEGVGVKVSGISPSGEAELIYSGSTLTPGDFTCDKTSGIRNGDSVKVSLTQTNVQYYAENFGKIPEAMSKEFKVSGLAEYISSYKELYEEFIANVRSEAEDTILAYAASSYGTNIALNSLEYAGYVLNSVKDTRSYVTQYNMLYVIYKGNISSSTGVFNTTEVYYPVKFTNVLKDENGDLSYESKTGISGQSQLYRWLYSTPGYTNPLTCYVEIAEAFRDDYVIECGDGFDVYSEFEHIGQLGDIDEAYKESLRADAKERIESYIASDYDSDSKAEDLSYIGEYLLVAKSQGMDFQSNNAYIVVYSATVSNDNGYFDTATVYFPVEYDGIVKLPDGEYMTTKVIGLLGYTSLSDTWYYTSGYTDGRIMYSEVVTTRRDKYKYEISENLKEFGGNEEVEVSAESQAPVESPTVESSGPDYFGGFLDDYVEFLSGKRSVSEAERARSGSIYLGFRNDEGYFSYGGSGSYFEQPEDASSVLHIRYAFTDLNGDDVPELVINHDYMGTKTTIFKAGDPNPEVLDFSMMFGSLVIYDNNLIGDFSSTTRSKTYYRMTEEGILEEVEEPTARGPEKELRWHEI